MKRVIDGVTYNTATAARVATWEYKDQDDYDTEATLYQSRGGAFFVVHQWQVDERQKTYFEAMTTEEIRRLVERTDNLEIIDASILGEPPEAAAEESAGATLYIRVPASLKDRIDAAATDDKLSVNAWAMRCMESCLAAGTSLRRLRLPTRQGSPEGGDQP